jgi:flagellar biosynthesis component FlhA
VLVAEPAVTEHLVADVRANYDASARAGRESVLVVASGLRPALAKLFAAAMPRLSVMSVAEIGRQVQLERTGVVSSASTAVGV